VLNCKRLLQNRTSLVYTTENANFTVYNPTVQFVLFSLKLYIFNAVRNFFIMVRLSWLSRKHFVNLSPHMGESTLYKWLAARKAKLKLPVTKNSSSVRTLTQRFNWVEFTVFTSVSFLKKKQQNFHTYENADTSKTIINSVSVSALAYVQSCLVSLRPDFWY